MGRGTKKATRRLAVSALLAALGVVLLLLGSLVQVLDLSMAAIASLLAVFAVIEIGGKYPMLIYAVTSVLSLLLLPVKTAALVYFAFAGYYPVVKAFIEKIKNRVIGTVLKLLFFNLMLTLFLIFVRLFVPTFEIFPELELGKVLPYAIAFGVGNLTFVLYDVLLTKVIVLYIFRIRHKLGLDKHR